MPLITGMKDGGYYDRHSAAQMSSMQVFQHRVVEVVANLSLPDSVRPITVLDLGSSEGRNAIHLMAGIVAGLRRRTDQPIQTVYSDLPSNNFNQLFANLDESRRADVFGEEVYPSAVGRSFYGPLLPRGSVHFAISLNAIHWLDRLPAVSLPDFVCYRRPLPGRPELGASSSEAVAAYTRHAEQELVQFLECRARELVPGGKLLLAAPGDTDQFRLCDGLNDLVNDVWLDLVADGRLGPDENHRLTVPCYPRTVAELTAPVEREGSLLHDAFSVERAEAVEVPLPFVAELRRGNVAAYVDGYTLFLRATGESMFRAALKGSRREAANLEWLFGRIRDRLLAEPEQYVWHYILTTIQLTRR